MTAARVASIQARLLAHAKANSADYQATLTRYGLERFLYRLSQTAAHETLWLKGALLFDFWFDVPHRPTREGAADRAVLARAIAQTFARRRTRWPDGLPLGLDDAFASDAAKRAQWRAFLSKNKLDAPPLDQVVRDVREFLYAPMEEARRLRV